MSQKYSTKTKISLWVLQIAAAAILLQTLFFKFTGAAESVQVFSQLGVEPWGRYVTGVLELIAGVLLLSWRYSYWGALLTLVIMVGAILAHIFVLGVSFVWMALLVFALALAILVIRRKECKLKKIFK